MNLAYKDSDSESPKPSRPVSDMREVLAALANLGARPIESLSVAEARKQPGLADAAKRVRAAEGLDLADQGVITHEMTIPGAAGPLPARVYRPDGTANEKLPVIVYWHGGGWVIGDLDSSDGTPRALARMAKAVVVSCHYRQAPEHKFPAAHDDAFVQYKWILANTGVFSGEQSHIAVAGEGAGANLAIVVAMMARDAGIVMPKHMVLAYPIAGNDMNTPSYRQNEDAQPLGKATMEWIFGQVFASASDAGDPRINLSKADLSGLPPTSIVLAEIDPLRSEGEELAAQLERAGGKVSLKIYRGMTHDFFGMDAAVDDALLAQKFAVRGLRQAFGTDTLL